MPGEVVAAVLGPILFLIIAVILFLLYRFYKRNKRFPWQKIPGVPYTDPEANYHEIEDLRAGRQPKNRYDYVEPKVLFHNTRGLNPRDSDEYNHLGDSICIVTSQYHTTASAAQEISKTANQAATSNKNTYSYSRLNQESSSKFVDNKYETVIPPGQAPRSPVSVIGSSPDYNFLTSPKPQSVLCSEYDRTNTQVPSNQESSSPADNVCAVDERKNSDPNKSGKPVPRQRKKKKEIDIDHVIKDNDTDYHLAKITGAASSSDIEKSDRFRFDKGYIDTVVNDEDNDKSDATDLDKRGIKDMGYVLTKLVDKRPSNIAEDSQVNALPVSGVAQAEGNGSDDMDDSGHYYSPGVPVESVYDTPANGSTATDNQKRSVTKMVMGSLSSGLSRMALKPRRDVCQKSKVNSKRNGDVSSGNCDYELAKPIGPNHK